MIGVEYDIDGASYYPYKTKKINGIKYYVLVNNDDISDIMIRKEVKEGEKSFLSQLEEQEFDSIINELEL